MKTSRIISDQHTQKLQQWLTLMGASAIWTRTNAEVYKKLYKTYLIVLFAILHFCQGRTMINLINKTKLFSDKQFYDIFLNFQIQV